MDDNYSNNPNNQRNFGMNRQRGNRFRHGGGNRPGQGHPGKGRSQRPLLTSAINGAGLCLVALVIMNADSSSRAYHWLAIATVLFGFSSIISYFAQRMRPAIFEKISDVLFLLGAAVIIFVALTLGKFI